jgi:hypothetical protein
MEELFVPGTPDPIPDSDPVPAPKTFTDSTHTDFVIISGDGVRFHVSKMVLVWTSTVFRACIGKDDTELNLSEPEWDVRAFMETTQPMMGVSTEEKFTEYEPWVDTLLKMAHKYDAAALLKRIDEHIHGCTVWRSGLLELITRHDHFKKYADMFINKSRFTLMDEDIDLPNKFWIRMHNHNHDKQFNRGR